jgi:hypothetical protein
LLKNVFLTFQSGRWLAGSPYRFTDSLGGQKTLKKG